MESKTLFGTQQHLHPEAIMTYTMTAIFKHTAITTKASTTDQRLHFSPEITHIIHNNSTTFRYHTLIQSSIWPTESSSSWCRRFLDLGLTTLSAQIGYIVPLMSMLQLKSEINEKVDNVTCWEYI